MANFVTDKGEETQSFGGNSCLSPRKGHFLCCNYSEERKAEKGSRWICCFDCRKGRDSILMAAISKSELKVNDCVEQCAK